MKAIRRFGKLTVYPRESAMHGALELETRRWGWIVFQPPMHAFGRWWPWFLYASPDATPAAATFAFGPGVRGRLRTT